MKLVTLTLPLFPFISAAQIIDNHFKIDQIGYRPNARKICVISNPQSGYNAPNPYTPNDTLFLKDANTNQTVFTGPSIPWNNGATHTQSGDKCWWFDFSNYTKTEKIIISR